MGRGQDREALTMFMQTIAQNMGPEAIQQYINPEEVIKRLATADGIDVLNLVKTKDEVQGQQQQGMEQQQQMEMTKQASKFADVEQKAMQTNDQQANTQAPAANPAA